MRKKGVVLCSGGLDSTTTMAIAKSEGFDIYALSIFYGQRHAIELEFAKKIARFFQVQEHIIINIDLRKIGGSALTAEIAVPKGRKDLARDIPITYVPARNTVFLSLALGWAEVVAAEDIFIGVNALDYSGYPDCRPEYIAAFEKMAQLATRAGVEKQAHFKVHTPLITLTKNEIINKGLALGIDYSLTWSCYDPTTDNKPCGECDSCRLRNRGFQQLGLVDPLLQK